MRFHDSENHPYFRVNISRGSCYGSSVVTVEIKFETGEKAATEFSEGFKKKIILLERAEAENFLRKISDIIEKPEVLTDLRSANARYHAEIEWRDIDFIKNEKYGEFKAFSNEWFIDQIEEFIEFEAETTETAERFQKILETDPHRHALEIYRLVKDFSRKYLM